MTRVINFPYDKNQKPFAFLNYPIELDGVSSYDLGDGFLLRKANETEKAIIYWHLTNYLSISDSADSSHNFKTTKSWQGGQCGERIDYEEINYTILEIENVKDANYPIDSTRIQLAFLLFKCHFSIMFTFYFVKNDTSESLSAHLLMLSDTKQPQRILNIAEVLYSMYRIESIKFSSSELNTLQMLKDNIYKMAQLNLDPKDFKFMTHNFQTYVFLNEISISSRFRILALFSVLEGLLMDPSVIMSKKAQYIKKALDNLGENHANFKSIISKVGLKGSCSNTLGTWVSKAYKYRNSIAHGYEADFNRELRIFNHQFDKILPLLEEVLIEVWKTLIQDPKSYLEWIKEIGESKPS